MVFINVYYVQLRLKGAEKIFDGNGGGCLDGIFKIGGKHYVFYFSKRGAFWHNQHRADFCSHHLQCIAAKKNLGQRRFSGYAHNYKVGFAVAYRPLQPVYKIVIHMC